MALRFGTLRFGLVLGAAGTLLVCGMVGCASGDTAEVAQAEPMNTVCPIGGHAIPADAPTATHAGTTIAFCCEGCAGAFADMSDAERDGVVAAAMGG